ncbi:MAG: TetR/AcrR family transcriptional regulator [Myxococcales bacterium]|nr:TetR/AcrR family transcriptional regulator [Myxococcales bacterium]
MASAPRQARAVATRERLVQAASELLAEQGLRGTTTTAVASRAGMSQGALFKHFPTKVEVLAGGTEAALATLVEAFRAGLPRRPPESVDERLAVGVDALWRVFRLPAMQGIFEVYLAARTDPELARALEPLLAAHRANIHAEARALLPELADQAPGALEAGVDAVVYAMQGVALGLFSNDETREREHLAFFRRLAVHELAAARAADDEEVR